MSRSFGSSAKITIAASLIAVVCLGTAFAENENINNTPSLSNLSVKQATSQSIESELQAQSVGFEPNHSLSTSAMPSGDFVYRLCHLETFQWGTFAGTDCWFYEDPGGDDYGIMGTILGIVVVNASTLEIVDTVPGPTSGCGGAMWRDIKSYQNYIYAVSECTGTNQGIMVIDMSFLPDSVHFVQNINTSVFGTVTSHNLSIDTSTGYMYVEGSGQASRNIYIFSLANPASPAYVAGMGDWNSHEIHDIYADNDTLYVADGSSSSFSIWDLAVKTAPVMLTRWVTPSGGYAHNIWPSRDRRHVVTTEETGFRTVKYWNIEDLQNIQLVGQYIAPSNLAHNAHMVGDTAYISHYESGLRVIDFSNPASPVELSGFDTWVTNNADFNGCWGMTPPTRNGFVFGSNMDGKMFVMQESIEQVYDSMTADSAGGGPGEQVVVEVSIRNTYELNQILIPFTFAGPSNLEFDSASVVGTRADYFTSVTQTSIDPFNLKAAYKLQPSTNGSQPPLAVGSGPVLKLYFRIPGGAANGTNVIRFESVNGTLPSFTDVCGGADIADTVSGKVEVCSTCGGCCVVPGDADHSFVVNIADATFLISRIFSGGPAPFCQDEADADGSNAVNIGDVTFLVSRIFSGGPAPICGTTGM